MALNPTAIRIAAGQLPLAKATLYTAPGPAGTKVVIPRGGITLVNTGAAARTINLYYKQNGGTSRRFYPKNFVLQVNEYGGSVSENLLVLEEGDVIEGDASVAAEVDYVISGYREDS